MSVAHRCVTCVAAFALTASVTLAAQSAGLSGQSEASPELIATADAMRMAQAALEDCAKRGLPTSVLVVDATGFPRVALSDNRAKFIGVAHNERKVASVLEFKVSTQVLQDRAQKDAAFAAQYGKDERYLLQGGGLPIYKDGKLVAAMSVGGSGNVNEACAIAGVKAVSWATTEAAAHQR